jgi:hypothetical protein
MLSSGGGQQSNAVSHDLSGGMPQWWDRTSEQGGNIPLPERGIQYWDEFLDRSGGFVEESRVATKPVEDCLALRQRVRCHHAFVVRSHASSTAISPL